MADGDMVNIDSGRRSWITGIEGGIYEDVDSEVIEADEEIGNKPVDPQASKRIRVMACHADGVRTPKFKPKGVYIPKLALQKLV